MNIRGLVLALTVTFVVGIAGLIGLDKYEEYKKFSTPDGCEDIEITIARESVWACLSTEGNDYFEFDTTTGHDAYICPDDSFGVSVIDSNGNKRRLESRNKAYTCMPIGPAK